VKAAKAFLSFHETGCGYIKPFWKYFEQQYTYNEQRENPATLKSIWNLILEVYKEFIETL
jgi:hypothetical protein